MIRNFLITGFRNLRNNRTFSLLNIAGLSIALSSSFIIFLFIRNEVLIDSFLLEKENTHFISLFESNANGSREVGLSVQTIADWLTEKNPEIKSVHTIRSLGSFELINGAVKSEARPITLTKENFFDYFNFELIHGNKNTALKSPNSIVISEQAAQQLFGDQNPIGQSIEIEGNMEMTLQVTGVIKKVKNTHLNYDCLISWDTKMKSGQSIAEWYKYSIYTYVKTDATFDQQLLGTTISKRYNEEFSEENLDLIFHPIGNLYFSGVDIDFMMGYRLGNKQSLQILSIVAVLILLIAGVNYVNINVSLALKRVKEIGLRKVMGASGASLSLQFLYESVALVLVSGVVAMTLADLFLSLNQNLIGESMIIKPSNDIFGSAMLLTISIIIGLLAGIFPAIFLSRFDMTNSLKNRVSGRQGKQYVRNILLGLQFVITIGLMVMSFVVYQQNNFIESKDLGFSRDEVLIIPIGRSARISEKYQSFRDEIKMLPEVLDASVATDDIGSGSTNNSYYIAEESSMDIENEGVICTYFGVDPFFVSTYGLSVKDGRNFVGGSASDSNAVIINEKLANILNFDNPIGKKVKLFGEKSVAKSIIGVVGDFNFKSLHKEVTPAAMYMTKQNFWNLAIKFDPKNVSTLTNKLEEKWKEFDSDTPYYQAFLNDKLAQFYKKDMRINTIISFFSILSIILSLIGLFGLTAFTVEQKLKEISIRKVLGAEVFQLLLLFNRRLLVIFFTTLLISIPVSYLLVNKWLENFAYHIDNNYLLYLGAIVVTILPIIITISLTALKATSKNPTHYLRNE